jgi:methylenetetrahydrofolate dehydrogenase (NADP+)/methenyltetrahydrofolate cyclohydrolase
MHALIDGRGIAQEVHAETQARVSTLQSRGITPGLLFIRVGEDPASQVYVGMKEKKSRELGIHSETRVLPESTPEQELVDLIRTSNADPRWDGILVQAPLPRHIRSTVIYATVDPGKDVDGFHPTNVGKLLLGDTDGFLPCTPAGVHQLLLRSGVSIEGAEVVILGRGNIVGKPMASILMQKGKGANATVTLCHSGSRNIQDHCRRADILIAAMGVPEFVRADMVRPGAVVIDVGVNRVPDPTQPGRTRLVGDVAFEEVKAVAGKITPNPGGVGPMTIAMLLSNTVTSAERRAGG